MGLAALRHTNRAGGRDGTHQAWVLKAGDNGTETQMRQRSDQDNGDRKLGNALIALGFALASFIPLIGFFGTGGGPRWETEARGKIVCTLVVTCLCVASGITIRAKLTWLRVAIAAVSLVSAPVLFVVSSEPLAFAGCLAVGICLAFSVCRSYG